MDLYVGIFDNEYIVVLFIFVVFGFGYGYCCFVFDDGDVGNVGDVN